MNRHPKTRMHFMSRLGAVSLLSLSLIASSAMIPAAASPGATLAGSAKGAYVYVALGDSFTSGQGAAPWVGGVCLRSATSSYPMLSTKISKYPRAINVACSGASTADIAGQIASVNPRMARRASLVTITVGGIDAGSNGVLAACSPDPTSSVCLQALALAQANLGTVGANLVATYSLVAVKFPKARIVVLTYPRLLDPSFPDPLTAGTVNAATDALNQVIAGAVAATNHPRVSLIDVTNRFATHGVGSPTGSFISFNPLDPSDPQNFHPNAAGNAAYAEALRVDGALVGP